MHQRHRSFRHTRRSPFHPFSLLTFIALLILHTQVIAQETPIDRPVSVIGSGIVVDTLADAANGDGACSLREALFAANNDVAVDMCAAGNGADTILLTGLSGQITLTGALPAITSHITLQGVGTLTIQRAAAAVSAYPILSVNDGSLTVSGLTLSGGNHVSGGAISAVNSDVMVIDSLIHSSTASSSGGGIYAEGGSLTITRSTVRDNHADSSGGGVYATGAVTITASTISGNSAGSSGGGIAHAAGTSSLRNSTVSGNSAGSSGGGVYVDGGSLTSVSSTIAANSAGTQGGGLSATAGTVQTAFTVIAGNGASDCYGTLASADHTLIQSQACSLNVNNGSNIIGQNPLLGALGDNGGATQTHALGAGSPAIDKHHAGCEPADQRGIVRPQNGACDIGAFEVSNEPLPPPIVPVDPPVTGTVIRGLVTTRDGVPLPNVTIGVLNSATPTVLTHADGTFSLLVDRNATFILTYDKAGYLPVQRTIEARWDDYTQIDDVALTQVDAQATTIDTSSPGVMQVAEGSVVTDEDGTRQAALLIPAGTDAQLVMPDGSTQPMNSLTIRVTEYTAGDTGLAAMPGELPPSSGYTYALEYSADEAFAAGAVSVAFDQPIYHYVENFLDMPVGGIVPMGYYDRELAAWVPSENGRVVAIVSITGGLANLDTDGNGIADNDPALNISIAEREKLAGMYAVGTSLWRVPITHFTPWDCNWPVVPPPDARDPQQPPPEPDPRPDDPNRCPGSVIECENQAIGESIPLVGTGNALVYRSDRQPGRIAAYTLDIPLTGDSPPASLQSVVAEVYIGGRVIRQSFTNASNQRTRFTWDGLDGYGRRLSDGQAARVRVGYVYGGVYAQPSQFAQAFALFGSAPITGSRARNEITIWQETDTILAVPRPEDNAVAGWTIDVHHRYDTASQTIHYGNGDRRSSDTLNYGVIATVAGTGTAGFTGDNGLATSARLSFPTGIATTADGGYLIADTNNNRVRHVSASGTITTLAGTGIPGYNGDGIIATSAHLNAPNGVTIGPDGSVYVTEALGNRIRRIAPDGIITTVAGTGVPGNSGDGSPAVNARLNNPNAPQFGMDGMLYFVDSGNHRVRAVTPSGLIVPIAGNGIQGYSGDGGTAITAQLNGPRDIAVNADGQIFIADSGNHRVRRITPDGRITSIAGTGIAGFSGDGGAAVNAHLNTPEGVAVNGEGTVFVSDSANHRVRSIDSAGLIVTTAGTGTAGYNGDNLPGTQARVNAPNEIAITPEGAVLLVDAVNNRIRRIAPGLPGATSSELLLPDETGDVVYIFSGTGRHLRTVHALTGTPLLTFGYDSAGRLITITDANSNVITIERNSSGTPTAIVAPFGQRTTLAVNSAGFISSVTNPANETHQMSYTAGGLLTRFTDPRGNVTEFAYDTQGRLIRHENALDAVTTISGMDLPDGGTRSSLTSPLNRTVSHDVTNGSDGQTRLSTDANGLAIETVQGGGVTTMTMPDGSISTETESADPRWAMLAPLMSSTTTTPGGRTLTVGETRTVNLSNPANPFSLTTMTTTLRVNGRAYTSVYNASTRTFALTSPVGRGATTVIDTQGRITSDQVTGLAQSVYSYDARGRLTSIAQGGRTLAMTYNAAGYLATITDPLNRVTSYTYDAAGRVTAETLPGGRTTTYTYNSAGLLTSLTPPGRTAHTFSYNALNQVTAYTPPDVVAGSDATTYSYNADRQVVAIALPDGRTITPSYDAGGRTSGMTIARGAFAYVYDAVTGNLNGLSAPGVNHAFTYDGGLMLSETLSGAIAGSVGWTYDNDFRMSSIAVNGANPITLTYDNDSLLTGAGALALTYNTQNGLLTGTSIGTAPNALTDTITYNTFAETTAYAATRAGSSLFSVGYTRDALGRITTLIDTVGGTAVTFTYAYDSAGRLITVTRDGVTVESYTYDLNGNRLTATVNGVNTSATYDAQDRLLTYGGASYTHNANGDRIARVQSGQTTTYSYDELGNLMSVGLPGGGSVTYAVDGFGRRIQRTFGADVRRYLWQSTLHIAAELDGANNVVSRFVYATRVNVPDYMVRGGVTYRILTDHLGSVRLVVDVATGTIVQRMDYDAWGNVLTDTNPGFQPFGFAGGLYDAATGLVRFGVRDYDPQVGRWTTKDPIDFRGGDTNLYLYVSSDPINQLDASGLKTAIKITPTSVAVAGAVGAISDAVDVSTDRFLPDTPAGRMGSAAIEGCVGGGISGAAGGPASAGVMCLAGGAGSAAVQGCVELHDYLESDEYKRQQREYLQDYIEWMRNNPDEVQRMYDEFNETAFD